MADRVYFCPDCRKAYSEARLTTRGQFLQCPGCKLFFTPAHISIPGEVAARKHENEWSKYGLAVKGAAPDQPVPRGMYRSPLKPLGKRRRRPLRVADYFLIWATVAVLLAIAGVMIWISRPSRPEPPVLVDATQPPQTRPRPEAKPIETETPPPMTPPTPVTPSSGTSLSGEWDALDEPLPNPSGGEIVALKLESGGNATVYSRVGLETETTTGRWKLAGSTLNLSFAGAKLEATVDLADNDHLRLTVQGQKPVEFTRKKH